MIMATPRAASIQSNRPATFFSLDALVSVAAPISFSLPSEDYLGRRLYSAPIEPPAPPAPPERPGSPGLTSEELLCDDLWEELTPDELLCEELCEPPWEEFWDELREELCVELREEFRTMDLVVVDRFFPS
jgi:hypothetical protein